MLFDPLDPLDLPSRSHDATHVPVYMSIINLIHIKYLNRNVKMMHVDLGSTIENNQYLTM